MQCLLPGLVTQAAATSGIMCGYTNVMATLTRLRKGTLKECSPHSMPINDVTLQEPSHNNG